MGSLIDEAGTEEQPLDPKPLHSLAPMFPTPPGYDLATAGSSDPPFFYYITPIRQHPGPAPASFAGPPPGPCSSPQQHPGPAPASFAGPPPQQHPGPAPASFAGPSPGPGSAVPLKATPISAAFPARRLKEELSDEDYTPASEKRKPSSSSPKSTAKRVRQAGDSTAANTKQRPIRRSLSKELAGWPSASDNPREAVEATMAMFDSLRRRTLQLDEKEGLGRRADLKASVLMNHNNLKINSLKTIGPVPGVEIGDIFFYRIEMCIVGLHAPSMAGIDYLSAKLVAGRDESLAVSIISSGGYENVEDETDTLVYTGQGGNSRRKDKEKHDQKLEKGNLALSNSASKKNQIRVVRSARDPFSITAGKVYIYDGVYRIEDSWMDTAKNGFSVFKYRLRREPGQPHGISVWKMTEKWKANRATRENAMVLDLSSGAEILPVCLVNEVDGETGPSHFKYVTGVKHSRPLGRNKPLHHCECTSVCMPGDPNCSCARQNGGDLPYNLDGVLARHVPMLYECSRDCHCTKDCRNRVAQRGVQLNFEVFRTGDRGWGLRSWDPIRAGAFVCEYAGQVMDETNMSMDVEEDEYTFRTTCPSDKALRWNLGAELLEEKGADATAERFKKLPVVISAKDAGNVARFVNHSCSPNLLWQAVQYDHTDDSYPHIMFFAMKHIPPMTELTYDYGIRGAPPGLKGKSPLACKLKPCLCGSANCRGSF
ncbi:hypothetical protein CFC21_070921 [Triticum aestivum]|uniref:Histone-lysine N-methyltransferase n=3 Tax=Triticum TaxID=4564 RepID=A0A9R0X4T8_TRITD|nr:histone-lysine N-methyltransferase, H3 lysine-9 specific SUVH1-like [Triticum aestivum]KAF7064656.1 hypothetical protein CFC21_070921 [Triticum aestivum]VAI30076.1 unnamed protein product [Triticum turgidum subsp. durum]